MRALDGFCGRGGWTRGLQAAGFTVDGFDLEDQPEYPGQFTRADARTFHAEPGVYDVVVTARPTARAASRRGRSSSRWQRGSATDRRRNGRDG